MNLIYKTSINIPKHVQIEKKNKNLIISGTKGSTKLNLCKLNECVSFSENNNLLLCSNSKVFFKCTLNIIKEKILGVSNGFLLLIRILGVGYRVHIQKPVTAKSLPESSGLQNQILHLKIGFSHDFKYIIPLSIKVFLLEPTLICLYGVDKNQVTQIAAKIRAIKPPSVYKGKGIKLVNEVVSIKQGKRK